MRGRLSQAVCIKLRCVIVQTSLRRATFMGRNALLLLDPNLSLIDLM